MRLPSTDVRKATESSTCFSLFNTSGSYVSLAIENTKHAINLLAIQMGSFKLVNWDQVHFSLLIIVQS